MLIHLAHIIHSLTRLVRRHLLQHFAPSRPRAAAFTKRGAIMYERSQRLRCYRWRHEYSKTRGSRVNGHRQRSIAPRREWSDRHFMNREPSLIDLSGASAAGAAAGPDPAGCRTSVPALADGSDVPRTWRRARRKCAAYLSGRLRRVAASAPSTERGARARMRRYRHPQKCARSLTYE